MRDCHETILLDQYIKMVVVIATVVVLAGLLWLAVALE